MPSSNLLRFSRDSISLLQREIAKVSICRPTVRPVCCRPRGSMQRKGARGDPRISGITFAVGEALVTEDLRTSGGMGIGTESRQRCPKAGPAIAGRRGSAQVLELDAK